jgi:predicted nucleic acid-binding Zn ribbon protein
MFGPGTGPILTPPNARALPVDAGRQCPACAKPLSGRQRACSGKCRAKLSRQRKTDELRVLARAARLALEALERRLAEAP